MRKKYLKEMVENNQLLNSQINNIEQAINDNSKYRKKYSLGLFLATAILILLIALEIYLFIHQQITLFFIAFFVIIGCYAAIIVINDYYKAHFRKYVIKNIISSYNSDWVYCVNSNVNGFGSSEYISCKFPFPEKCDRFFSEDLIFSKTNSFKFADILVQTVKSHSDSGYTVSYYGSLSRIDINDVKCNIFLDETNKRNNNKNGNNIEILYEEFNKQFKVYSDNDLLAKKVLTSHVLEQIVNLKKSIHDNIDIRLLHDKLYVRYSSGDSFVPSLWNRRKEKNSIIQSIATVEEINRIINSIKSIIEK